MAFGEVVSADQENAAWQAPKTVTDGEINCIISDGSNEILFKPGTVADLWFAR